MDSNAVNNDVDKMNNSEMNDEKIGEDYDLITLSGFSQISRWYFPKNTTSCPDENCQRSLETRSAAIIHFKEKHAMNALLCLTCNMPISVKTPEDYFLHYRNAHPEVEIQEYHQQIDKFTQTQKMPESPKKAKENVATEENPKSLTSSNARIFLEFDQETNANTQTQDENEDDLITISGLNWITEWKFPKNLTQCPVHRCNQDLGCNNQLEIRSAAISHFKERHAKRAVFCFICEKLIICWFKSSFDRHYRRIHPNKKIPFNFMEYKWQKMKYAGQKKWQTEKDNSSMGTNNECKEIDDLITLSGCGLTTEWRFPKCLKKCPVSRCDNRSRSRLNAILHYKKQHAMHSILCPICVKPICALHKNNFLSHHRHCHPDKEIPYNFDTSEEEMRPRNRTKKATNKTHFCHICKRVFSYNISRHMREVHSTERIRCPLITCHFVAKRLALVREHWQKKHPNLEFPEMRQRSGFGYSFATKENPKSLMPSNPSVSLELNRETNKSVKTPERQEINIRLQMDNENENDLIETNVSVSEQAKRDTDLPELTIESSSEDSMWEEILLKYAIKKFKKKKRSPSKRCINRKRKRYTDSETSDDDQRSIKHRWDKRHSQKRSNCGLATVNSTETTMEQSEPNHVASTSFDKSKPTPPHCAVISPEARMESDKQGDVEPLDLTTCITIIDSDEETKTNIYHN